MPHFLFHYVLYEVSLYNLQNKPQMIYTVTIHPRVSSRKSTSSHEVCNLSQTCTCVWSLLWTQRKYRKWICIHNADTYFSLLLQNPEIWTVIKCLRNRYRDTGRASPSSSLMTYVFNDTYTSVGLPVIFDQHCSQSPVEFYHAFITLHYISLSSWFTYFLQSI